MREQNTPKLQGGMLRAWGKFGCGAGSGGYGTRLQTCPPPPGDTSPVPGLGFKLRVTGQLQDGSAVLQCLLFL